MRCDSRPEPARSAGAVDHLKVGLCADAMPDVYTATVGTSAASRNRSLHRSDYVPRSMTSNASTA